MNVIPGQLRAWSGNAPSPRESFFLVLSLQEQHSENGDGAPGYRKFWDAVVLGQDGRIDIYTLESINRYSRLVSP